MQVVVRVLNLGLGVVVTAIVTRTLGSAGYGQWSTILTVLTLIGLCANFGAETIVIREAARDPDSEHEWLGAALMMRLFMVGPVVATAVAALVALHENEQMLFAGLILVITMPFSGASVLRVVFVLRVKNAIPMLVLTIRSVFWAIAVGVVFLIGGHLIALAIGMSASTVVGTVVQVVAARRVVDKWPRPSMGRVKELFKLSMPVGVAGMFVIAYGRVDQIIVFTLQGSTQAGLYGSVSNVLEQAHFVPISIITTVAPIIAASWPANRPRIFQAVRQATELMAMASFGVLVFLIVAATQVTRLLFGPAFLDAAPALPVLGGAFVFICFGYVLDNLLVVLGLQRQMMYLTLVALIINVAGNLVLVPAVGFIGAAWMTLATEVLVLAVDLLLVMRALQRPLPSGRTGRVVLSAAGLYGLLAFLDGVGASLPLLVLATSLCYPALLIGLRALDIRDIRLLLRGRAAVS